MRSLILVFIFVFPLALGIGAGCFTGCKKADPSLSAPDEPPPLATSTESLQVSVGESPDTIIPPPNEVSTSELLPVPTDWLDLQQLDTTILLDIRYATANNFMEEQIYDCGRCWLRPNVAEAILRVQTALAERGLGLKMYDCYRPAPYQQRLWDKVPDPRYVANPARGSVHGRGAAVDLTLVNLATGTELEMGTDYDFFGPAAHSAATDLPAEVLQNRQILQAAMRAEGFLTIRTEWWHFNFSGPRYPLSDELWECE